MLRAQYWQRSRTAGTRTDAAAAVYEGARLITGNGTAIENSAFVCREAG